MPSDDEDNSNSDAECLELDISDHSDNADSAFETSVLTSHLKRFEDIFARSHFLENHSNTGLLMGSAIGDVFESVPTPAASELPFLSPGVNFYGTEAAEPVRITAFKTERPSIICQLEQEGAIGENFCMRLQSTLHSLIN